MYQIIGKDTKTYLLPNGAEDDNLRKDVTTIVTINGKLTHNFLFITLPNKITQIAFKDKTDRAGVPYYHHLKKVANMYQDPDGEDSLYVVGMLHDLLEDCPEWTSDMLRTFYPDKIVDAIVLLTKKKEQDYEEYIDNIKTNVLARTIKIADLHHNMDITRLPILTQKDFIRLQKYHKSYLKLTNF